MQSMQKLLSTILVIAILFSTGIFSIAAPNKAEAALTAGQTVNYRIYHAQLRNYLLNYSAIAGRNCNITPRPSFCLSLKSINEIMAWVRDPNGDGDKSDGLLNKITSNARLGALNSPDYTTMRGAAKGGFHPWIMAKIVIPWEVGTRYKINPPDLSADNAVSFADSYWKNFVLKVSDTFTEFRFVGDYATGDTLVRDLAYWKQPGVELAPGVPKLVLKPKSKVSAAARDKLYGVRRSDGTWKGGTLRLQPYRDFKNDNNWDPDEVTEMDKAISFQNSVEEYMATDMTIPADNLSAKYKKAKVMIGLWDGVMVGLTVIPPVKALRMAAMAKSGAEEANVLSKVAKITRYSTAGYEAVPAELSFVNKVGAGAKDMSRADTELAIQYMDDVLKWQRKVLGKAIPSETRTLPLSDFDVRITDKYLFGADMQQDAAGKWITTFGEGNFLKFRALDKDLVSDLGDTFDDVSHEFLHTQKLNAGVEYLALAAEEGEIQWLNTSLLRGKGIPVRRGGYDALMEAVDLVMQSSAKKKARGIPLVWRRYYSGYVREFPRQLFAGKIAQEKFLNDMAPGTNFASQFQSKMEVLRQAYRTWDYEYKFGHYIPDIEASKKAFDTTRNATLEWIRQTIQ